MRNIRNPFKFGSIVEGEYFTDRVKEVEYIKQFIQSPNHLILISPRRFGKSSGTRNFVLAQSCATGYQNRQ